jgi:hypothetical protein
MPAFEGEDIDKMKELMDDEAKEKFRAKRKRIAQWRLEEVKELRKAFGMDEEDIDGILGKVDGS